MKKLLFVLAIVSSIQSVFAGEQTASPVREIQIHGENHMDPSCMEKKVALVEQALRGDVALAMEGFFFDNNELNRQTLRNLPIQGGALSSHSLFFGLEDRTAYALAGVVNGLSLGFDLIPKFARDPYDSDYIDGMRLSLLGLYTSFSHSKEIQSILFKTLPKSFGPSKMDLRLFYSSLLGADGQLDPDKIRSFLETVRRVIYPRAKAQIEALGGPYAPSATRMEKAKKIANASIAFGLDTAYFNILLRDEFFATHIRKILTKPQIVATGVKTLHVIVGRQHVAGLKQRLLAIQQPSLIHISSLDLCPGS